MEFYRGKVNPNWIYKIVNDKVYSLNLVSQRVKDTLNPAVPRAMTKGYKEISENTFNELLRAACAESLREHIVVNSVKSKMIRAF